MTVRCGDIPAGRRKGGKMGKYFGTDGFRGEANIDLKPEHAFKIGRYLGWYFSRRHKAKIVIGKDTRRSSYMYENALAAGITASGADAYLLHVTTTPCVSYITRREGFDCGVMISASHNAFYDNGIKLINGEGEKMDEALQDDIERYIDGETEELPYAQRDAIGSTVDFYSGRNRYIGYLTTLAAMPFDGKKIALDCANGSTWMIAGAVFMALGAEIKVINNQPDGTNINRGCGSTHIEGLQAFVRDNHMDCGFAFDGDGDRCLAVDERGELINGDKIIYVCAKFMKDNGRLPNNTVVTTVMSNMGLYKALEREGVAYEQTAVGDRFVYEAMKAGGHLIGGEQSGHIIFRKHAHSGDGLITAIMLTEVMMQTQLPLSALASGVTMYPQVLTNVVVTDKETALSNAAVQEAVKAAEAALGDNGRVLLRASGTEPLLRVMAEATEEAMCRTAVNSIISAMEQQGLVIGVRK